MSPQEVRQLGVALVAAGPGLALAAFVAGMTLPMYDVARVFIAAEGVVAVLGGVGAGVVIVRVTDPLRLDKLLRIWLIVSATAGSIALLTLYTDYPEVDGLLTSLSSIVFSLVVLVSGVATTYVVGRVGRSIKTR